MHHTNLRVRKKKQGNLPLTYSRNGYLNWPKPQLMVHTQPSLNDNTTTVKWATPPVNETKQEFLWLRAKLSNNRQTSCEMNNLATTQTHTHTHFYTYFNTQPTRDSKTSSGPKHLLFDVSRRSINPPLQRKVGRRAERQTRPSTATTWPFHHTVELRARSRGVRLKERREGITVDEGMGRNELKYPRAHSSARTTSKAFSHSSLK